MKKSKFLKNSKDLLSRSFNPAKCKTALKLAGSRVKLLRNKKEVQVKQMKREIAQLLESGQDQTARIRVEHVVREEKMMAAYDLIEIYSELIVARMQIIENQKICPSDLKEAIASVIFASPRCGDVPELKDVKKNFTEKYGKEFVSAAVELRPESGVSRLMVEKLSAAAPDGQSKIKILSAIAEEHNVKWDPKSLEEKDSIAPADLLKGPRTFEETKPHVEPHIDFQAPQSNHKMHGPGSSLYHTDHMSSPGTERHTSNQTSGVDTSFHHEARTAGDERAQLFQGDSNGTNMGRQRWNMEFKDATAAAQAAAESAELASMAARAAAELSSRDKFMRQYSMESHQSEIHVSEQRGPETYLNSTLGRERFPEEIRNRSFSKNTSLHNEQMDGMQRNNPKTGGRFNENSQGGMEFSQSASLKSKASFHDYSLDHDVPDLYSYNRKNSLPEVSRGEMNMERQSSKYTNAEPETFDDIKENRIGKRLGVTYSPSRSKFSDEVNIFATYEDQKFESDAHEDPFPSSAKRGINGETSQTNSWGSSAVVFDKSDSENDTRGFDMGPTYDNYKPGFHLRSPSQKSHKHHSVNPDSWSQRSNSGIGKSASPLFSTRKNPSDFSEKVKSVDDSKADDSMRVTFDESDESPSESDFNMYMSSTSRSRMEDSRNLPSKYNQPVRGKSSFDQPALKPGNSQMESNYVDKSSPDDGVGLNLPKLRGGLRHKGNNPPPFLKNRSDMPSSFSKKSEATTATITRPTVPSSSESSRTSTMHEHKKSELKQDFHSGPDSNSSEGEESLTKRSGQKLRQYTSRAGKEVKVRQSLAASNSYFGSDNSDSDKDPPKESLSRTSHRKNGISQRTKAPSFGSGKNSYAKIQFSSDTLDFDDEMDVKPTDSSSETLKRFESSKNSSKLETYEQQPTSSKVASQPVKSNFWGPPEPYSSGKAAHNYDASVDRKPTNDYTHETRKQYPSLTKNSSQLGNSEPPTSAKAASKPHSSLWRAPDQYNSGKGNSTTVQESKKAWNLSSREELSSTQPKMDTSVGSENPKAAATLNKTSSNKDGSNQRASHVHPKLPDYDTLVQTLRKNRS